MYFSKKIVSLKFVLLKIVFLICLSQTQCVYSFASILSNISKTMVPILKKTGPVIGKAVGTMIEQQNAYPNLNQATNNMMSNINGQISNLGQSVNVSLSSFKEQMLSNLDQAANNIILDFRRTAPLVNQAEISFRKTPVALGQAEGNIVSSLKEVHTNLN